MCPTSNPFAALSHPLHPIERAPVTAFPSDHFAGEPTFAVDLFMRRGSKVSSVSSKRFQLLMPLFASGLMRQLTKICLSRGAHWIRSMLVLRNLSTISRALQNLIFFPLVQVGFFGHLLPTFGKRGRKGPFLDPLSVPLEKSFTGVALATRRYLVLHQQQTMSADHLYLHLFASLTT